MTSPGNMVPALGTTPELEASVKSTLIKYLWVLHGKRGSFLAVMAAAILLVCDAGDLIAVPWAPELLFLSAVGNRLCIYWLLQDHFRAAVVIDDLLWKCKILEHEYTNPSYDYPAGWEENLRTAFETAREAIAAASKRFNQESYTWACSEAYAGIRQVEAQMHHAEQGGFRWSDVWDKQKKKARA